MISDSCQNRDKRHYRKAQPGEIVKEFSLRVEFMDDSKSVVKQVHGGAELCYACSESGRNPSLPHGIK